jgi:hypothetical protein
MIAVPEMYSDTTAKTGSGPSTINIKPYVPRYRRQTAQFDDDEYTNRPGLAPTLRCPWRLETVHARNRMRNNGIVEVINEIS